jgi:hypothetical protein
MVSEVIVRSRDEIQNQGQTGDQNVSKDRGFAIVEPHI